jgi:hypothetical protein
LYLDRGDSNIEVDGDEGGDDDGDDGDDDGVDDGVDDGQAKRTGSRRGARELVREGIDRVKILRYKELGEEGRLSKQ